MIPSFFKRMVPLVVQAAAISVAAFGVSGCGGGGDGSASGPTIRPKTLDGIILNLDGEVKLEFLRNLSSPPTLESGDEETGTFIYTSLYDYVTGEDETRNEHRNFDNLGGTKTLTAFPQSIALATYTYRAINDSSAVLTLTAVGADSTHFGHQIPFIQGSYDPNLFDYTITKVVQIDLTFTSNGSTVTTNVVTFSLPESTMVSTLDTMRIQSTISLATGGSVPENYNPAPDPNRPSKIAPESLSGLLMSATNGIPDATKNFTIQFVKDGSYGGGYGGTTNPDEIGRGLLRVTGSAVDVALDYTWRRIGGTDNGELVLSNIPDNAMLPFDSSLNGTYTLSFSGKDTGAYIGKTDSDTPDAAEVSGTFNLLDGN